MAVYTHVSSEALADFLTRYDVGDLISAKGIAEGVENSNYMVDTTRGRYFLTLYEKRVDVDDLPFFIGLLDHLAERGNPVPPAIRDVEGKALQQLAGRAACLIQFLPGVSVSHPTANQAGAVGAAMAQMHLALDDFIAVRPNSLGPDSWRPLLGRCGHDLDMIEPGLFTTVDTALTAVLANWPTGLVERTIHADLFPDNVLMLGDRVSGLIDFYFACTDVRVYDLAVMHSAWAFTADGVPADAAIGNALIAGYESVLPLLPNERAALCTLAQGACIRFLLTRAWDWLNTPAGALVTRKDPIAYRRRLDFYRANTGLFG